MLDNYEPTENIRLMTIHQFKEYFYDLAEIVYTLENEITTRILDEITTDECYELYTNIVLDMLEENPKGTNEFMSGAKEHPLSPMYHSVFINICEKYYMMYISDKRDFRL